MTTPCYQHSQQTHDLKNPIKFSLSVMVLGLLSASAFAAPEPPYLDNGEFQQCLNTLKNSSGFSAVSPSTFERYRPTAPDPSVVVSLNYQPEFDKKVWDYLSGLVDDERAQDGVEAKQRLMPTLRQIEQRYDVDANHVLGVWGVESNFGKTLGKKDLIDSLATLSCFDRRQSYFRTEYANALKILQRGDIRREDLKGSWAGAFGQTQFMPSTFLRLAQDFDGDGRKDLVNSEADALASTANFLAKSGYRTGEPWGYEVKLPTGYWANSNRKDKKPISYWRAQGLTLPDGQPLPSDLDSAGLLLPAGVEGPAFLVGKNFDTFYSYNASENYALAIAHLSDMIRQNRTSNVGFATPWPTDDPGISRRQAREIQQALLNLGYDIGNADGIIGDKTRYAIQDYQRKQGVNPDGRAGMKLYRQLVGQNGQSGAFVRQPTNQPSQYRQPTTYHQPSGYRIVQPVVVTPVVSAPNNNRPVVMRRVDTGNGVVLVPSR